MARIIFPKGFLWGTATASYQVEGNISNDWSEWESSPGRIKWLEKRNKKPEDYMSKKACDHYYLYEKDFDLAKAMHNNAHRFSVEWARIEPEQGKFDREAIEHYKKVVYALRKRGLEPFLTAYHFTLPRWLAEKGGWLNENSAKYFEEYVSILVKELKDVKFWVTINEPNILISNCYLFGLWPPNSRSLVKTLKAARNIAEAHKRAYKAIHKLPNKKVGIAQNMAYLSGVYKIFDYFFNWYFLDKIKNNQDFVGINYYMRRSFPKLEKTEKSEMGWDIYPKGIYYLIKKLHRYGVPIYITENGIADSADKKRKSFIVQHLKQVHQAIKEGADARGYFYWSLMDNFEWEHGFTKKFGVAKVDFKSMKRIPRKSFYAFKEICKSNSVSQG